MAAQPPLPPLGPLSSLPPHAQPLASFKILLLVTSVNSFTQRVLSYLQFLGFDQVSVQLALSDEAMLDAAEKWQPDIVLCPFLTKKLPASIHNKWITLVVHPGPPGDAGPSSLDWALLGDTGTAASPALLPDLLAPLSHPAPQRTHWGTICFQATERLDGGHVWAWEQYELPRIGTVTKAQLYQGLHSAGAMSAVVHALTRVYESTAGAGLAKSDWVGVAPKEEWQTRCVSLNKTFLGGNTQERPLLQSTKRRPDWTVHTAKDVLRILNASDSQPGAMLNPLTKDAKGSLFAYGAHLHESALSVPSDLYISQGYESFDDVPDGKALATRDGAVFIKTRQSPGSSAGIWITHGRVPRGKDKPLDPKIPMTEAIQISGHGKFLEGVGEWKQERWEEKEGEWQEVYVKSVGTADGIAQLVYWNFYNGAFTTTNCRTLLSALRWAVHPSRGTVKVLALMGGTYFSNGIALNTIEHAASPGRETWDNINAIDDIVSFLASDVSDVQPEFMRGETPLCKRGIVTVACIRGNAAAGGVALAAACDVVVAGRGVVINPSYRGMGLHGSELHSFSYLHRCGPVRAAEILREMKPLNSSLALAYGLIDGEIGSGSQSVFETEPLFINAITSILSAPSNCAPFRSAPWAQSKGLGSTESWLTTMARAKVAYYTVSRNFPPLQHFRNEELSQMLLDSFHPVRSERYHSRRTKFIRKLKPSRTAARYALHSDMRVGAEAEDEEDKEEFDNAPGWVRGEEWGWVGLDVPGSMDISECLRIPLYPPLSHSFSSPSHLAKPAHLSRQQSHTTTATATTSSSSGPDEPFPQTPSPIKPIEQFQCDFPSLPRVPNGQILDMPVSEFPPDRHSLQQRPGLIKHGRRSSTVSERIKAVLRLKKKGSKDGDAPGGGGYGGEQDGGEAGGREDRHEVLGRALGKGEREVEWSCLVTGGEGWEGHSGAVQGQGQVMKVEQVN